MAFLRGELVLPSREELVKEEKLPPGTPKSKAHYLLEEMFTYYDDLELAGHGKPYPEWAKTGFWLNYDELVKDPKNFRNKNLYVYPDGRVELK